MIQCLILILLITSCNTVYKNGIYQTKRYKHGKVTRIQAKKQIATKNAKNVLEFVIDTPLTSAYLEKTDAEIYNEQSIPFLPQIQKSASKTKETPTKTGIAKHLKKGVPDELKRIPEKIEAKFEKRQPSLKKAAIYFAIFIILSLIIEITFIPSIGLYFLVLIASYTALILAISELINLRISKNKTRKLARNKEDPKAPKSVTSYWSGKFTSSIIFYSLAILSALFFLALLGPLSAATTSLLGLLFILFLLFAAAILTAASLLLALVFAIIGLSETLKNKDEFIGQTGAIIYTIVVSLTFLILLSYILWYFGL